MNDDETALSLSFAQVNDMKKKGLCFKCGKHGHMMEDCPKTDTNNSNDAMQEQTHTQQG